jgi:predicted small metal-binding protein
MTRVLHCADAGFECDKTIEGESDDDVMSKAAEHAREAHGMNEIDEETGAKIRSLTH